MYTLKNVLENQLEALLQPDKQPDSSYPIKSFHFPLKNELTEEEEMTASTKKPNKKTKRKQNIEQNNLHINCEIAIVGARAVCSLLISEITFLTLVDITAVSWLTAGLTK